MDYLREATRRISNIHHLSYDCDGYDVYYRIEVQPKRDECSRDMVSIELCDEYDKNTGEPYISAYLADNVVMELINSNKCIISRHEYGGYLISAPNSSDIFLTRAIFESLELAEKRNNDCMIYSGSSKVSHSLISPSLIVCEGKHTSQEFINHMSLKFKDLVERANKIEADYDNDIEETLRNIASIDTNPSAGELVDLLDSLSCNEPIVVEQRDNEIILSSRMIEKIGMDEILGLIGDVDEYYEHIAVDCKEGKILTTNPNIIADLRAYLIKKTLRL
uniref:Uncharacterized protein n=1 Tax=viral metagenome TaxID=1070528 RepID=A0A6C0BKU6_9ZZZZ